MNSPSIAPLRNVAALMGHTERLITRTRGLPGLGVFHGKSGSGKSTAVIVVANEFQAHVVQMKQAWTKAYLVEKVAEEMGATPRKKTTPYYIDAIAEHLAITDRPLIIDDAQYMLRGNMIELVRDIYESSLAPIVLVGEANLPHGLTKWENIHNRVLDWQETVDCNLADASKLADIYCPGVDIAPDLMQAIVDASSGAIRRVATNLDKVKELARRSGKKKADLALWGDQPFFTGAPPVTRKPEVYPGASAALARKAARG
ncbi:transposition protein [Sagittula sp. P11]|uniref:AAA family ATPase n=1 Tax=Sagittula sp. P11 TaxID=2009329 RepID=UPI000C2D2AF8|nr:ATP-binding protein [Sagittula sp. P11]AUC54268.1 transposition protein [Sagittula sp. P11]